MNLSFLSLSSCQSLCYLSISAFLRLFSLFPALKNHGLDPCREICPDKMSLSNTHMQTYPQTLKRTRTLIHTSTHIHVSKKPVFVLIKRQAGSKMNCNDFQAVLMANKSWIRTLTRTPPLSHTHAHTHTCKHTHTGSCFMACCAGFIQESDG